MKCALIGSLLIAACAAGGDGAPPPPPPKETKPVPQPASTPAVIKDVMWRATEIDGAPPVKGANFTLMFDSGGRVGGKSGCNGYSASYQINADGKAKVYPPMIGTMMACAPEVMEQEQKFQSIVGGAVSVVATDGGLLLSDAEGRIIRFKATAEGTRPGPVGPAPVAMIMRCGSDRFAVRFFPDRAIVRTGKGEDAELPRLQSSGEPETSRTYTNGRMTFVHDTGGDKRGVRFARGRMAFVDCEIALH